MINQFDMTYSIDILPHPRRAPLYVLRRQTILSPTGNLQSNNQVAPGEK